VLVYNYLTHIKDRRHASVTICTDMERLYRRFVVT